MSNLNSTTGNEPTVEGNKLIAVFTGWEANKFINLPNRLHKMEGDILMAVSINHLEYHTSWDALMPACHKWDNLNIDDMKEGYEYEFSLLCDALDAKVTLYEIGPAWRQLVENIQWYNLIQNI